MRHRPLLAPAALVGLTLAAVGCAQTLDIGSDAPPLGDVKWLKGEPLAAFVAAKDDAIGYAIAFDPGGSVAVRWLQAAGERGIPCSFVIDKKRLQTFEAAKKQGQPKQPDERKDR